MYIRKVNLTASKIEKKGTVKVKHIEQYSLFDDIEQIEKENKEKEMRLEKEEKIQQAFIKIKQKYGKNAVLKGTSALPEATMKERNQQIGGHKA